MLRIFLIICIWMIITPSLMKAASCLDNIPPDSSDARKLVNCFKDEYKHEVLHFAVKVAKNPEMITNLINMGYDPNVKDEYGQTPLHKVFQAIITPDDIKLEIVKVLLRAGADPNIQDNNYHTPLYWARFDGVMFRPKPSIFKVLLEAGADPNIRDERGQTPFESSNNAEIRKIIEDYKRKKKQEAEAEAAKIAKAAEENKQKIEEQLRTKRVSCEEWNTAKFFRHAKLEELQHCLETKDPNQRNERGQTVLHLAAIHSKIPKIVIYLTSTGVDPDIKDHDGRTALHLIALFGKTPEMVMALLEAGANLNEPDKKGRTALQLAEKFDANPEILSALREAKEGL